MENDGARRLITRVEPIYPATLVESDDCSEWQRGGGRISGRKSDSRRVRNDGRNEVDLRRRAVGNEDGNQHSVRSREKIDGKAVSGEQGSIGSPLFCFPPDRIRRSIFRQIRQSEFRHSIRSWCERPACRALWLSLQRESGGSRQRSWESRACSRWRIGCESRWQWCG